MTVHIYKLNNDNIVFYNRNVEITNEFIQLCKRENKKNNI